MKLVLNENEFIVTKKKVIQWYPLRIWFFFETDQGRKFTCNISCGRINYKQWKDWEKTDFDGIKEGRYYPFAK